MSENDIYFYMQCAIELAKRAAEMNEVPVGAVVVDKKSGEITGRGYNRRESLKSPLAHAEIIAIDEASRKLGGWRIVDSAIFVTLEPCPMCSGAIINSRIDELYFGAYDNKNGSAGSVQNIFTLPYIYRPSVHGPVMQKECSELLSSFFRELRMKKK